MRKYFAAAILPWLGLLGVAAAQAPAPAPTAPASAETPAGKAAGPIGAPLKIIEEGTPLVARFPTDNPFGSVVDFPAIPPVKPVIPKILMTDEMYAAIRVDARGKTTAFKRVRDPIPSIAADTQKSFMRWVFDPPRKGGQPVDAWTSVKLELAMEVDPLKIETLQLIPSSATRRFRRRLSGRLPRPGSSPSRRRLPPTEPCLSNSSTRRRRRARLPGSPTR